MVDVPLTLSACARLPGAGGVRRTDPAEAFNVAQVALFRRELGHVVREDQTAVLRLLSERHDAPRLTNAPVSSTNFTPFRATS